MTYILHGLCEEWEENEQRRQENRLNTGLVGQTTPLGGGGGDREKLKWNKPWVPKVRPMGQIGYLLACGV